MCPSRRGSTARPPGDGGGSPCPHCQLESRLVAAKAEIQSLKDMLAQLRQSRDDWKAQAERLAGKLTP